MRALIAISTLALSALVAHCQPTQSWKKDGFNTTLYPNQGSANVLNGAVYVAQAPETNDVAMYHMAKIDLVSGNVEWNTTFANPSYNTTNIGYQIPAPFVSGNGNVYQMSPSGIRAISESTGKTVWTSADALMCTQGYYYETNKELQCMDGEKIYSVDTTDGKTKKSVMLPMGTMAVRWYPNAGMQIVAIWSNTSENCGASSFNIDDLSSGSIMFVAPVKSTHVQFPASQTASSVSQRVYFIALTSSNSKVYAFDKAGARLADTAETSTLVEGLTLGDAGLPPLSMDPANIFVSQTTDSHWHKQEFSRFPLAADGSFSGNKMSLFTLNDTHREFILHKALAIISITRDSHTLCAHSQDTGRQYWCMQMDEFMMNKDGETMVMNIFDVDGKLVIYTQTSIVQYDLGNDSQYWTDYNGRFEGKFAPYQGLMLGVLIAILLLAGFIAWRKKVSGPEYNPMMDNSEE